VAGARHVGHDERRPLAAIEPPPPAASLGRRLPCLHDDRTSTSGPSTAAAGDGELASGTDLARWRRWGRFLVPRLFLAPVAIYLQFYFTGKLKIFIHEIIILLLYKNIKIDSNFSFLIELS
jgi:hypothetical protein